MKKVLLPLVGAGIFLLDESLKNYAEENLQLGTEKKLTGRIVLRRVHNQGVGFELLSECPEEVKKLIQLKGALHRQINKVSKNQ